MRCYIACAVRARDNDRIYVLVEFRVGLVANFRRVI
jgi:hypothetical protein